MLWNFFSAVVLSLLLVGAGLTLSSAYVLHVVCQHNRVALCSVAYMVQQDGKIKHFDDLCLCNTTVTDAGVCEPVSGSIDGASWWEPDSKLDSICGHSNLVSVSLHIAARICGLAG